MRRNYENLPATDAYRALSADLSQMPFSFVYDGTEYKGFSEKYFTLIHKDVMQSNETETQTCTFCFLHCPLQKLIPKAAISPW